MRIAVLGAGLQGCGVALELAVRGVRSDIYDRASRCMDGASRNNEGKVHLGFVYGNDPTRSTARLMAKSALAFQPLLRRWLGADIDRLLVSRPFYYAIARDSVLSVNQCLGFFGEVHQICQDLAPVHGLEYFGMDLSVPPERVKNPEALGLSDFAAGYLSTYEVAVDPEALADIVDGRVRAEPLIGLNLGGVVVGVERLDSGFEVTVERDNMVVKERYDRVINALWDGRLTVDAQLNLAPTRPWLFRYKEFVQFRSEAASRTPSITIIQGPYGDVVNYGGGRMYLSWYPVGLRFTTPELQPPSAFEVTRDREAVPTALAMVEALARFAPDLAAAKRDEILGGRLGGGWIFGWGASGIEDPTSGLHMRSEIGPFQADNYITIDSGKFTTAPMFAIKTADLVTGRG